MDSKNVAPKVAVIMLNWNTWEDTIEALESIYQNTYLNYEVIVVDNASVDNSVEKIKEYAEGKIKVSSQYIGYDPSNKPIYVVEYTKDDAEKGGIPEYEEKLKLIQSNQKLIIIKNDKNYGYPEGNNIGIRYILKKDPHREFKYILLLNNDVVVDRDWLRELVKVMELNSQIGVAGSKILDYSNPCMIQSAGGYFYWWIGWLRGITGLPDDNEVMPQERDFVWSTSSIFRRSLFENVGLLDSSFFFGIEEYDFCKRAQKSGYKILYVPSSKIWHKKGSSFKKVKDFPEVKKFILGEMGFLRYKLALKLFKKHLPPVLWIIPFTLFMTRKIVASMVYLIYSLSKKDYQRVKRFLNSNL